MSIFSEVVKDMQGLYPDLKLDPSGTSARHSITTTHDLVVYEDRKPGDWETVEKKTGEVTVAKDVTGAPKLIIAEFASVFEDFKKEAESKQNDPIENLKAGGFDISGETKDVEEEQPVGSEEETTQDVLSEEEKLAKLSEIMDGDKPPKRDVKKPDWKQTPRKMVEKAAMQKIVDDVRFDSIPESVRSKQITDLTEEDIKNYINPHATMQEAGIFLRLCQARGLNPFLKEAHLIKYSPGDAAQFVTGKDAFTRRAEVNPHVKGWKAGIIIRMAATKDSPAGPIERREGAFKLPEEELLGGWAEIHRDDSIFPFKYEVTFDEYIGKKKDGTVSKMWKEKPCTMIRKDALVGGLRESVTSEFGGMYDPMEMGGDVLEAVYQEVEA